MPPQTPPRRHSHSQSQSRSALIAAHHRRSSDYVLLDRLNGSSVDVPLPRPRYWLVLVLLGIADLSCTVSFSIALLRQSCQPQLVALIIWGLLRGGIILAAAAGRRIRETGWIFVGSALASALAALAQLNLFIQSRSVARRHHLEPSFHATYKLGVQSSFLAFVVRPPSDLSSIPPTLLYIYLSTHILFLLLHWVGFAIIVGLSSDRNPYGLGLQTGIINNSRGAYREGTAEVRFTSTRMQDEPADGNDADEEEDRNSSGWSRRLDDRRQFNERSFDTELEDEECAHDGRSCSSSSSCVGGDEPIDAISRHHYHDDDGIGDSESEHDPNDIIDIIPSPSVATRHRTISTSQSYRSVRSRRSYHVSGRGDVAGEDEENELIRDTDCNGDEERQAGLLRRANSAGYGTFRSLAGI